MRLNWRYVASQLCYRGTEQMPRPEGNMSPRLNGTEPFYRSHLISLIENKVAGFYKIRPFITVSTKARYCTLSWTRWIESTPSHPVHLRTILILSSHLRLILPRCIFPFSLPTKTFYAVLFPPPPPRHIFPTHLVLLDLIVILFFHLCVGLASGHFLTNPTRILCFSPLQCVLHFPPFSSFLIYHPNNIWCRRHIMIPTPSYTPQVSCSCRSHFSPLCRAGAVWLGWGAFQTPTSTLPTLTGSFLVSSFPAGSGR